MAERIKKTFWLIVVAFALYSIFSNPGQSGQTVHQVWDAIRNGFHNLGQFFQSILNNSK